MTEFSPRVVTHDAAPPAKDTSDNFAGDTHAPMTSEPERCTPQAEHRNSRLDRRFNLQLIVNIVWRVLQIAVTVWLVGTRSPFTAHWIEMPWAPIVEEPEGAAHRTNR